MVILDTNVLSELVKPSPDAAVIAWVGRRQLDECAVAAPTLAELTLGLRLMPEGARRSSLASRLDALVDAMHVLAFERASAVLYGEIAAARRRAGRPIAVFDALIAATARAHDAAVATRDASGFTDCGVVIIDPWLAGQDP